MQLMHALITDEDVRQRGRELWDAGHVSLSGEPRHAHFTPARTVLTTRDFSSSESLIPDGL